MTATLVALALAGVILTTVYVLGWSVGAVRLWRALAVLAVSVPLAVLLTVLYLDALDGVETAAIFINTTAGLAVPFVAWFGWDVGREHRADERRRHRLRTVALVLALTLGTATLADTTSVKPAEAVTAPAAFHSQTSSGPLRTWIWRGPHCGTFPFLSMEYLLFNQTFGCSMGFTTAGTTLLASPWWSYFQQLLVGNSILILLVTLNITVLQAGAQWCRAQGLTLWARWRTDANWLMTIWGIVPQMSCFYPTD